MHRTEKQSTTLQVPAMNVTPQGYLKFYEDQNQDPPLLIVEAKGLLNEEQYKIIFLFLLCVLHVTNITAIIGNSLNIAVFVKLGFSEPSNISLTALAVSDLTCVLLSFSADVIFMLDYEGSRLPFNPINVAFLTSSGLWSFVNRTVAWITAFISFERCLCILLPLKVKRLVTRKTTLLAMLIIGVLTICPYFFIFLRHKFVWIFYPDLNATILDVARIDKTHVVLIQKIIFVICGVLQPLLAFLGVIVCTIFLVIHLRKVSIWRKSVTSAKAQCGDNFGENDETSKSDTQRRPSPKEDRLVRMVVVIAVIFVVSFTPTCVMLLFAVLVDEFSLFGVYKRMYMACGLSTFLTQSLSSSVNIVIYYNMASKFRSALRCILRLDCEDQKTFRNFQIS
ncbi:chemosensory receptor a [Plakobranchus ocellatus]|uniref:Chemosensory receptor a n=1 Tax=Plakobranchus ocellatus TaxID=259542 RepID=A0AAV4C8Z2_9GAST|nr:chemosensory receptor a [Plakobranchus ocellatus]